MKKKLDLNENKKWVDIEVDPAYGKKIILKLSNIIKEFDKNGEKVRAVNDLNLNIKDGEMVCFLGPSGCGKTTTLRMVAGFEIPTSGEIKIEGRDVTNIPVNKRGIGFVFQNYALFPHLSVAKNIGYGLENKGMDKNEIKKKVNEALELVGLPNIAERYPTELSGGEQQRVALARVLVMEPSLLLMDEPLSNLDAKLRIHMRTEIRHLQQKLGITALYVTHDQAEALTVADKIVVMSRGVVEQVGSPKDIYYNPSCAFVADFIGQANVIRLKLKSISSDTVTAELIKGVEVTARKGQGFKDDAKPGDDAILIARPENIAVKGPDAEGIKAKVLSSIFVGSLTEYELAIGDENIMINASVPAKIDIPIYNEGDEVRIVLDKAATLFVGR